jgi:hypothetical protein
VPNNQSKHVISVNVLPGEPTDGTGRVCVHLFVQDSTGPFVEPHALHPVFGDDGVQVKQQVAVGPARGRLACDPKRSAVPVTRGNTTTVTPRSDDWQAVTCLKCKASKDYKLMANCSAPAEVSK